MVLQSDYSVRESFGVMLRAALQISLKSGFPPAVCILLWKSE